MKKEKETRETQGHKKMLQYLEDLMRNENFLKEFEKYKKNLALRGWSNDVEEKFGRIIQASGDLDERANQFVEKDWPPLGGFINTLRDFGLDTKLFGFIDSKLGIKDGDADYSFIYTDYVDMCVVRDRNDEYYLASGAHLPVAINPMESSHLDSHPISIDIHVFATKNDVLDYIEKNWGRIYESLGLYSDYKKRRIKKRRRPREIIDFIWEKRDLPHRKIQELLEKRFPDTSLVYYEIAKILDAEKQRRLEDFAE